MSKRDYLAPPPPPRRERMKWTRAEDYLPNRRRRRPLPRTDLMDRTEAASQARPLLGIIPFMLLMLALGVMAVSIMIAAFPGQARPTAKPRPAVQEQGTAAPGWLKG